MLFDLRAQGLGILYISHRMHEIEALAETCSVFRNGRHIETFPKGTRSADEIVSLMIGREIESQFPPKPERPRPAPLIAVEDLAWENRLRGRQPRGRARRDRRASAASTDRARRSCSSRSFGVLQGRQRRGHGRRQAARLPLARARPSAAGRRWR